MVSPGLLSTVRFEDLSITRWATGLLVVSGAHGVGSPGSQASALVMMWSPCWANGLTVTW